MAEKCPKCGYKGEMYTKVRQYPPKNGVAIVDVGFECPKCHEQWGFEGGLR